MTAILKPMKNLWKLWILLFSSTLLTLSPTALSQAISRALLPQGTLLERLEDQKIFSLSKDIYVNIIKDNPLQVMDHKGHSLYTIPDHQAHKVIFIDQISNIYQNPKFYKEYPSQKKIKEKPLNLSQDISFNFYQSTTQFLSHLTGKERNTLLGWGGSYQAHVDFHAPILLGIKLNYIMARVESLTSNQFTLGPVISYPLTPFKIKNLHAQFSTQSSLFFKVKDNSIDKSFDFKSQSLNIGLQYYRRYQSVYLILKIFLSKDFISQKNKTSTNTDDERLTLATGLSW